MISLLSFSLICLELFATVTATKPLLQRTPRRHSLIQHNLDRRLSGLLVFTRQSGPCCPTGGCCNAGEFCNGDGCCLNGDTACTAAQGGGCCLGDEYCDAQGCCLKGEVCSGPSPGTITFDSGGGGFTDTSVSSDTLSSAGFPSSNITPLGSGTGFGTTALPITIIGTSTPSAAGFGSTPFPAPASGTLSVGGSTPSLASAVSGGSNFPSPSPAAGSSSGVGSGSAAGVGGKSSATSKAVIREGSILVAVAILSIYLL